LKEKIDQLEDDLKAEENKLEEAYLDMQNE